MAGIACLPLFHALHGRRVVVIGEGAAGEARRRLVARAGAIACSEAEAHHAALAFVALGDAREAAAAALRMRRRGLLVNVADRPDLCDFTVPSILDRDPVLIAIGSAGVSAGLVKHLRLRLETILPQSLGTLARRLFAARGAMRERWTDASDRRRALDAGLREGGMLDPLRGDAAERVQEWIERNESIAAPAHHSFTLASDDPDDLTLRQARLLGEADTILHDPAVPATILARARADAARHLLPFDGATEGMVVELRHG